MSASNWVFIGAGNMAGSLIGGLVGSGVKAQEITAVDINADTINTLKQSFNVQSTDNIANVAKGANVVIAVKPNIVKSVCESLNPVVIP